jgi:hypothetical protein
MLDWERTTVYVATHAKIMDPKGLANYPPLHVKIKFCLLDTGRDPRNQPVSSRQTDHVLRVFPVQGRGGWTLKLRDSINLSVHLSDAAVKPYPTPVSTLKPRNLVPE